jgi:hypothetical protein
MRHPESQMRTVMGVGTEPGPLLLFDTCMPFELSVADGLNMAAEGATCWI